MMTDQREPHTPARFRLSREALLALEKSLPSPGAPTNPIEAGFQLGVQFTLKKLRDGYTIGVEE